MERQRIIAEGFEHGWEVIQTGITKLLQGLPNPKFTSEEYMTIYTTAYNLCTVNISYFHQLYDGYKKTIEDYISSTVLPSLREKQDELLLKELVKTWLNHKLFIRWLTRFFDCLDRRLISDAKEKKRRNGSQSVPVADRPIGPRVIPVAELSILTETGFRLFHDMVYGEIGDQVRNAVISMIDQEREGEQIDQVLIRNILEIYVEMGMGSMGFYKDDFEAALLKSTTEYYSRKAASWNMMDSYSDYILKEIDRASRYFHSSSQQKLLEIVEHELLTNYQDLLHEKKHFGGIPFPSKDQKNMATGTHNFKPFEEGWAALQDCITKLINIVEGISDEQFTSEDYMRFYNAVYDGCSRYHKTHQLYDLYKKILVDYITSKVLPLLREKNNEVLLKELVIRWSNHKLMVRWLVRFFNYLSRYFLPAKKFPSLEETGFKIFNDLIYLQMNGQMRDTIISMIDREREGGKIDRILVKNVLDMFVEMGRGSMKCYEKDFEAAMLENTTAYYAQKASKWIMVDVYTDYMLKGDGCLKLETDRASDYLHPSSKNKLLEKVEHELHFVYATQLLEKKQSLALHLLMDDHGES